MASTLRPNRLIPLYFQYLSVLFGFSLLLFALHRGLQLFLHFDQLNRSQSHLLWYCFFNRGLLFDSVTAVYLLLLPGILLSFSFLIKKESRFVRGLSALLISFSYIFALAVSLADIPYYSYYNARINRMILAWTDDMGLMLEAVYKNAYYLPLVIVFVFLVFILIRLVFRFTRNMMLSGSAFTSIPCWQRLIWFLLTLGLLFLGIRGDYKPSGMPLQVKHAFETRSPFINQLGLNPVFNFIHTFTDFKIDYLPDSVVINNVRQSFQVKDHFRSPVARRVNFIDTPCRANVVLVVMESMYAGLMERQGNPNHLSPVLDSLARLSVSFDNAYCAGIHTYNGLFSTLFSLPALMQNKPTMSSDFSGLTYAGLPNVLKREGYRAIFFVTGSKNFDNFQGVFPENGFDTMIGEESYPREARLNNWGVGDHVMFEQSLPYLDRYHNAGFPFLAVYMTVSTHSPYSVPGDIPFKPNAQDSRDRGYQYADWSVGHFLTLCSKKEWYKNTLFVFVADHGQNFDPLYDLPLSYHHSPLIFFFPGSITPSTQEKLGLQIDIFPTVMGFLHIPYINNTMGIDLMTESRPFAYFSADYKLGILDLEYYLIIDKSGKESLYRYRQRSLDNLINRQASLADSMKRYTFSMLQTTQYLVKHRITSLP